MKRQGPLFSGKGRRGTARRRLLGVRLAFLSPAPPLSMSCPFSASEYDRRRSGLSLALGGSWHGPGGNRQVRQRLSVVRPLSQMTPNLGNVEQVPKATGLMKEAEPEGLGDFEASTITPGRQ